MQINYKATNLELTDGIKSYTEKKMSLLDKFVHAHGSDTEPKLYVELERTTNHHKKGDIYRAELQLRVPGHELYAECETDDLYKSIDFLKDDVERQLAKIKDKEITGRKQGM